jgi:phospholipid/cholesterol/gamma-HCH transport system ATP-binding protein
MPEEVLRFDNVSVHFDQVVALDRVSFAMHRGQTRVIFGAAGSGKTVLLKAALGLVPVTEGRIYLFGQDITGLTEEELFAPRARVGILFQEGALFDSATVEENVAFPLLNRSPNGVSPERLQEIEHLVLESLRFVELAHTLEKFPSELSGGMRRRVGIARAIVTDPPLVLYDSPTAGLDPITANTIMAVIAKERDMQKTSSLIVTHRYQDGQLMADFRFNAATSSLEPAPPDSTDTVFMVMREGRLTFEGTRGELEASSDQYLLKFVRR